MGTDGFREDELVSRKVKVGNEWAKPKYSPSEAGSRIGPRG